MVSFSQSVKEELINSMPSNRHCRISELSAILGFAGKFENGSIRVFPSSENAEALRKCFTLLNKTFNINTDVFYEGIDKRDIRKSFIKIDKDDPDFKEVLDAVRYEAPSNILSKDCCKRAYLRGAFISAGFINNPEKAYHFEIIADDETKAYMLKELLEDFGVSVKLAARKKYYVVYAKDFDTIQDILNILNAHKALMEFVNTRIVKDFRNDTNRRVNCEVANSQKAVSAASKQIDDINFIKEREGLELLPDTLREMAVLRLNHPESSFAELGELLDPPVGKSGVNHRLRKLSEYAQALRSKGE